MQVRHTTHTALRQDATFAVNKKQYTDEGFLDVYGVAAKIGVLEYPQSDGTVRRELVTPAALRASVVSIKAAPVTLEHPPDGRVDAENARYLGRGHVIEAGYDEPSGELRVKLRVEDAETIARIEAGEKIGLSPGYDVVLDESPGEDPEHGPFDAKQVERKVNHVAVTGAARGGEQTSLKLDSKQMEKIEAKLDALEERQDMYGEKLDAVIDALKEMREDMMGGGEEEAQEDAEHPGEEGEEKMDREDAIAFANERFRVLGIIEDLGIDVDLKLDNAELKRAVVKAKRPDNTRVDSATEAYIDGVFDEVVAVAPKRDSVDPFVFAATVNRRKREDSRSKSEFLANPDQAFFSRSK